MQPQQAGLLPVRTALARRHPKAGQLLKAQPDMRDRHNLRNEMSSPARVILTDIVVIRPPLESCEQARFRGRILSRLPTPILGRGKT
jgi:hypothetical protein